jgi:hypothetical protein
VLVEARLSPSIEYRLRARKQPGTDEWLVLAFKDLSRPLDPHFADVERIP